MRQVHIGFCLPNYDACRIERHFEIYKFDEKSPFNFIKLAVQSLHSAAIGCLAKFRNF